jgi:sporulation protein YlmC with PRC-barrel domain
MRRLHLSFIALAAMSGLAVAQTTAPSTAPGASAPSTSGGLFATVQPNDLMASNLIDLDVYNQQNEEVGEIADLIFDTNKTVRAIIVEVGGFLGLGKRYVALDPSAVQITRGSDGEWLAVVNATRDQLRNAPELNYEGEWDD